MKKLLLTSFLFTTIALNAQIKTTSFQVTEVIIGKTGTTNIDWVVLKKKGDLCTFTYQDNTNTAVSVFKSFSFKDVDNALEGFYKVIMDGFETLPKEDVQVDLPDETIKLQYTKEMGMAKMKMKITYKDKTDPGMTVWLNKKQINKIFGKE